MNELIDRPASAAVAEYSPTEAALNALRARMANVVYDVSTTKGLDAAKRDRAEVRGLRTALEAKRVELKAPALERSRLIDAEAKRITAELVKIEQPIDESIKAEEARKAVEKAAKEQAEREKAAALQDRIDSMRARLVDASGQSAATILHLRDALAPVEITLEEFGDRAGEAAQIKAQVLAKLEDMRGAAELQEAVLASLAKQQEELRQQKAEQEARDKAERERIAAERKAFEDEQAAARAEAKKREDADSARRDEEDRKAREARAAEDKRLADARAEVEAQQRAIREAAEAQATAARKAEQDAADAAAAIERKRLDDEAAAERQRLANELEEQEAERQRIAAQQQRIADAEQRKRIAAEQAAAAAAKRAAAKLAQAQKCGPRLLAALHAAYDECAQLPEGTVSTEMMDEAIAAINEAEGARA